MLLFELETASQAECAPFAETRSKEERDVGVDQIERCFLRLPREGALLTFLAPPGFVFQSGLPTGTPTARDLGFGATGSTGPRSGPLEWSTSAGVLRRATSRRKWVNMTR